jgi:ribonuclease HI
MQGHDMCNVNVGFHDAKGRACAGLCVRDHMGMFILAGSSWIQRKCSTIEGEAAAMLEAMKELEQRGFTNVVFETDSKNVADAIHFMHIGVSKFSSIITKIKCILSLHSGFEVKSTKRQANMIAHIIVRGAIS